MILYLLGCSHLLPTLVSPGVAVPCRSLSERVDSARPIRDVSALASSPRRSEARKEEVRALLEEQLTAAGLSVERRPFEISGIRGVNLVASGPDGGRILVGAHYDTVGSSPGADDNASGVAVLLEVARVLGPSVPVTYVLFDAEEPHEASVGRDEVREFLSRENPGALAAMEDLFRRLAEAGLWVTRRNSIAMALEAER